MDVLLQRVQCLGLHYLALPVYTYMSLCDCVYIKLTDHLILTP